VYHEGHLEWGINLIVESIKKGGGIWNIQVLSHFGTSCNHGCQNHLLTSKTARWFSVFRWEICVKPMVKLSLGETGVQSDFGWVNSQ
jgi:hypothetical protein